MVLEIIAIVVSVLTPLGAFLGSLIIYKKQAKEKQKDWEHESDENQKNRDYDFKMRLFDKTPEEVKQIMKNLQDNQDLLNLNKDLGSTKEKNKG